MRWADKTSRAAGVLLLAGAAALSNVLAGCGMPAAPQPPSLTLPDPVGDLAAARSGNEVTLTWTMPRRDTDKVAIKGPIAVRVCRREGLASPATPSAASPCATVANLALLPAAQGKFAEPLPPALAAGAPRALDYYVELVNRRGRSAGLSNAATMLAGQAPAPVTGLEAGLRNDGIVLRWMPGPPEPYATQVRLQRTLLASAAKPHEQGPLSAPAEPPREPVEQSLLVPANNAHGRALDDGIRFGETYAYRAQRIARVSVDGKTLELDGPLSQPVRIDAEDIFPPAVPAGLAAVATPAGNGAEIENGPAIDLSWQPDIEADAAGYAVYRREAAAAGQVAGPWRRISPAQPLAGPAFHDANVQPGHTYEYAVTAIGRNGRESARSAPAEETVPGP